MDAPLHPDHSLPGAKALRENLKETLIDGHFGLLLLFEVDAFQHLDPSGDAEAADRITALIEKFMEERKWKGYRLGGDQFGLILERSDLHFDDEALDPALRLFLRQRTALQLTLSGGGVRHPGEEFNLDPQTDELIFSTAHRLLLRAKRQGRNRILWLLHEPGDSGAATLESMYFYRELARINAAAAREMKLESQVDFLTGLANRRGFEYTFQRLSEASQRGEKPIGLLYMDSDSLKGINDSKGHEAGDRFIVDLAKILEEVVRGSDFISRWGADEFAVIMDDTTPERALALARRIHQAIARRTEGTTSIGVYCGIPKSVQDAVNQADAALYRAKRAGKNRIEVA